MPAALLSFNLKMAALPGSRGLLGEEREALFQVGLWPARRRDAGNAVSSMRSGNAAHARPPLRARWLTCDLFASANARTVFLGVGVGIGIGVEP
jgi:hypothetical protein